MPERVTEEYDVAFVFDTPPLSAGRAARPAHARIIVEHKASLVKVVED
jgi:hypothetical protein